VTAPSHRSGAGADLGSAGQDRDATARRRELVAQLKRNRVAAGLSQADVAKLMETSQPAVARLESGRHDAQLPTLARYAEALGLSLLSLDLAGDAGTPDGASSDDTPAEAATTPSMEQASANQTHYRKPPRPKARPGRKLTDDVPAVTPQAPDMPGPDHVLTSRQRDVLRVIRESIERRGHPPSLQEIGEAVGLTSTSSVSHHLRTLQRAGYLHRDSGRPRTVEIRDYTAVLRVWSGTGFGLRRNAFWVRADDQPDGRRWDLVATRFADMGQLAEYAASFGPAVVVLAPPDLREAVIAKLRAAELKVRPVMSGTVAKPVTAGGIEPGGAQVAGPVVMPDDDGVEVVAARLGSALAAGRRVRLLHFNPKTDRVIKRDVDPMGLFVEPGRPAPYLLGWCRLREEKRFFRLDRVLSLEVLDVPASPPAEAEHLTIDQGLFRPSHDDKRVELELSASGRWVAEYYPCDSVSKLDDGRLHVVLRTPDTGWVRRLAWRLGEDGRVVSPPELAAEIRNAASAALANYDGGFAAVERGPGDLGVRPGSAAAGCSAGGVTPAA
jgi:predicted DNA-binding transcriptional regulator YafY/transcriptional regulator with XRE-family HTH domain